MRCLRRILKIRWDDVRELKIRNSHVRKNFNNIDTIKNIISKRRLIFIGEIIRMTCKGVPVRLIFAFQMERRPLGRPNITVQHSFISNIEKIISNVDPVGRFNSWARVSFDETRWAELVNILESKQTDWNDSEWKDN